MKKFFLPLFATAVIAFILIGYAYRTAFLPNVKIENPDGFSFVYISSNANYQQVLDSLSPILINKNAFELLARVKNFPNKIKPGKYKIQNDWSNNQLINHLRSGKQEEVKLVFNYSSGIEDLAGLISKQIEADSAEIYQAIMDSEFMSENGFNPQTVMCMFVPNTYHFYWNSSAVKFRDRMLLEYRKFWNADRLNKAAQLNFSNFQVCTLASIVQKETSKTDERPVVAGLYLNRLRNNWRLESDPTVLYAMKLKNPDSSYKRVLYSDLKIESPYNTYQNAGLPPGPICIAEINAIDAVLNHQKHSYFFMCASPSNLGYHNFARTLKEHSANAKKYQAWLNSQNINR